MPYFICLLTILLSLSAEASCKKEDRIPGQYIVVQDSNFISSLSSKTQSSHFKTIKKLKNAKPSQGVQKTSSLSRSQVLLIESSDIQKFKSQYPLAHVQENCRIKTFQQSSQDDTFFSYQQWFFKSLEIEYQFKNPRREIIVAVSDTGIRLDHPDLASRLWVNQKEQNGQRGVDDDGNGYVDDIYGYDFADQDANPTPSITDTSLDVDHGTHVAGLIGAESFNSRGVSGTSLNGVKLMALKGFKSHGDSNLADLLESIYYAVDNGAKIINASWGVEKAVEYAEIAAINYALAHDVVVVVAAGNDRVPASWMSPASIKNVVTVASVNSQNQLSTFSNYGEGVDFIAPGGDGAARLNESLLSSALTHNYMEFRGTSMAAPLISGAIGLLMSQNENLTAFQAVHVLKQSGVSYNLSPYDQNNDQRDYIKPSLKQAFKYIEEHPQLPPAKPRAEDLGTYQDRSLSSLSAQSSGGGCSNSLSGQSLGEDVDHWDSEFPLIHFLFFMLPLLVALKTKKALK